jgi:hypothetical protein
MVRSEVGRHQCHVQIGGCCKERGREGVEKDDGGQEMQRPADPVVQRRLQVEEFHVGHVRQPRQRTPIRPLDRRESPGESLSGQPASHHPIAGEGEIVVEVDKTVEQHWRER